MLYRFEEVLQLTDETGLTGTARDGAANSTWPPYSCHIWLPQSITDTKESSYSNTTTTQVEVRTGIGRNRKMDVKGPALSETP